jgi:PPOX class probable FMN-dependent enzyme
VSDGAVVPFDDVLTSVDQLRALYRPPIKEVAEKKSDRVAPWARAFIEAAPFAFIATSDREGRTTVSPKGGAAGFVTVLDERRLAIPDYPGNNLIDSLQNLIDNPHIGIILVIPGRGETLRVDGRAWITTDPAVIEACAAAGRTPKTVIGVSIADLFIHCPSSFNRGRLWARDSWRADASASFVDFVRGVLPPDELPDWALAPDPDG